MAPAFLCRLLLLLLLSSGMAVAADWSKLKLGMTAAETSALLGEPLFRSAGQGFETWIYDNQAEVLFYGPVIGWTSPRTPTSASRQVDVWQAQPGARVGAPHVLARPPVADRVSSRRVTATVAKLAAFR